MKLLVEILNWVHQNVQKKCRVVIISSFSFEKLKFSEIGNTQWTLLKSYKIFDNFKISSLSILKNSKNISF